MQRFRDRDQDSWTGYMWLMVVLLVAEGGVLHLWLGGRSVWWTVGLGAVHLLAIGFLFADWRRICAAEGWRVGDDELTVELGWRVRGRLSRTAVESVVPADERSRADLKAHLAGIPELLITLREPVELTSFGRARIVRTLLVAVEDPRAFAAQLTR